MSRWSLKPIARLFLFEHGAHLLRPTAASWLLYMWFLITLMAGAEFLAWFKIFGVALPSTVTWMAAPLAAAWGLTIWIVDATFAKLDVSPDYQKLAACKTPDEAEKLRTDGRRKLRRGWALRGGMICLAALVSIPMATRSFDERKVLQEMQAENSRAIAAFRLTTTRAEDAKIAAILAAQQAQRDKLENETAGNKKSISGHTGDGPVARAVKLNMASLQRDLDLARADKAGRLAAIASMTPEQLRQEGVELVSNNADTQGRIRAKLERAGGGDRIYGLPASQVIASALLCLLFVMMVLLKLFQPRSVVTYLNDYLQEEYEKYLAGGFAALPPTILDPSDRHDGPSPMRAQRFDTWYHGGYLPAQASLEAQREKAAAVAEQSARLQAILDRKANAIVRKQRAEAALDDALTAKWAVETELSENRNAIAELEQKMLETTVKLARRRRAILNAERTQLEGDKRRLEDRRGVIVDDLCTRIPDGLEAAMTGLGKVMNRHGRMPDETPTDEVRGDPAYQQHLADRGARLTERHDLQQEKLKVEKDLERILERMRQIETAMASGELGDVDLDDADDDLRGLRNAERSQMHDRDERAAREVLMNQKLRRHTQTVGDLETQFDLEREAVATFQDDERETEASVHTFVPRANA